LKKYFFVLVDVAIIMGKMYYFLLLGVCYLMVFDGLFYYLFQCFSAFCQHIITSVLRIINYSLMPVQNGTVSTKKCYPVPSVKKNSFQGTVFFVGKHD